MRPHDAPGELFSAFSRICSQAFVNDRLLSCPTLSKAPNYGDILRRYLTKAPHASCSATFLLKGIFRYLVSNIGHLLFLLLARLYIMLKGWALPEALVAHGQRDKTTLPLVIIDSFAVLPRLAQRKQFEELYLPGLFEEAQENAQQGVRLYRLYGSRHPRVLWQAFGVLAATGGVTESHLFTLKDWWALCCHICLYPLALWKLVRSLGHYAPHLPEAYIRTALIHSMGQCVLLGEARRIAAFRLAHYLAQRPFTATGLPKIISWYENQTINKAFQRGLAQAEIQTGRHVRVVGAQLFTWPANLLNNHPDDAEAALGLAPDVVAVNGPYFLPEASTQTYTVGPSVRYKEVFAATNVGANVANAGDGNAEKPLLVLLSYHPEETRRVLELVLPLATEKGRVVYKFHPATQPSLYGAWLPPNPQIVMEGLFSALQNAGAVIGAGSGSLLEAAAIGIPVLAVEASSVPGLGLNYFPQEGPACGKGEIWAPVSSAFEVEAVLERLHAKRKNTEEYAAKVKAFRDLVFTEPTKQRLQALLAL